MNSAFAPVLERKNGSAMGLVVTQVLGVLVLSFSVMLVPPIVVSMIYADGQGTMFAGLLAVTLPIGVGGRTVPDGVVRAIWAFFAIYVFVFATMMVILMGHGLDQVTAFGAVATCLNNLGPGLGEVATNFASIGGVEKWVLVFAMIAGRLEIFTILVLLTPAFWRW